MRVQLITDLHAQLALAPDALAQPVQLLVLLLEDLGVVGVDLLVVELGGVVAVAVGLRVRVVAVAREEGVRRVLPGILVAAGAVAEADRFGGLGGGCVGEVRGEGVVVGGGEGCGRVG